MIEPVSFANKSLNFRGAESKTHIISDKPDLSSQNSARDNYKKTVSDVHNTQQKFIIPAEQGKGTVVDVKV